LAVVLLVRILLPTRAAFLNPYTLTLDVSIKRLATFFHAGIPLSLRGICCILLGLTLAGRAAILATTNMNQMPIAGPFLLATFNAQGFIDWFLIECLDFAFFYFSILSATTFFRLWHLLKPIPGFVADTFFIAAYPFTRLKLHIQFLVLILGGMLLFAAVQALNPNIESLFQITTTFQEDFPPLEAQYIQNLFNLQSLPIGLWHLTLSLLTMLNVLIQIADILLMFGFLFLIALLMRAKYIHLFIHEALQLICGRFKMFRIGVINLTPILLFLLFPFIYFIIAVFVICLAKSFVYVV
ncbi:MAG: hypothetical protein Q4F99_06715, partial [bacterium]|nr:hypothetical protein [bacterium]